MSSAGNDTYEAWRESDHDDLVLAAAIACWYGEKKLGSILTLPPMYQNQVVPVRPTGPLEARESAPKNGDLRWGFWYSLLGCPVAYA